MRLGRSALHITTLFLVSKKPFVYDSPANGFGLFTDGSRLESKSKARLLFCQIQNVLAMYESCLHQSPLSSHAGSRQIQIPHQHQNLVLFVASNSTTPLVCDEKHSFAAVAPRTTVIHSDHIHSTARLPTTCVSLVGG